MFLFVLITLTFAIPFNEKQEKEISSIIADIGNKLALVGDSINNHNNEIDLILTKVREGSSFEGASQKLEILKNEVIKMIREKQFFSKAPVNSKLLNLEKLYDGVEKKEKKVDCKKEDSKQVKEAKKEVKKAMRRVKKNAEEFKLKDDVEQKNAPKAPRVYTPKPLGYVSKKNNKQKEVKKVENKEPVKVVEKKVEKKVEPKVEPKENKKQTLENTVDLMRQVPIIPMYFPIPPQIPTHSIVISRYLEVPRYIPRYLPRYMPRYHRPYYGMRPYGRSLFANPDIYGTFKNNDPYLKKSLPPMPSYGFDF